jgi:hypothetical protein
MFTCRQLDQYGTHSSIFSSFTSTQVYSTFESHREMYAKIWNLYTIVNEYFGLSNLFNVINIFITGGFNIYTVIVSHSSHISMMMFIDPFQNVSHACILIVVMIDTCRKSDKIVRVKLTDLCVGNLISSPSHILRRVAFINISIESPKTSRIFRSKNLQCKLITIRNLSTPLTIF